MDLWLIAALANAVLDCIEESRAVVLIPSSSDPGLGSGLLTAIHEALVERQTRLIFIESEMGEGSAAGSLAEALQLLSETGKCVTWRGRGATASSSFWKHLRFYLLPSQRPRKGRFLSQTSYNQGLIWARGCKNSIISLCNDGKKKPQNHPPTTHCIWLRLLMFKLHLKKGSIGCKWQVLDDNYLRYNIIYS